MTTLTALIADDVPEMRALLRTLLTQNQCDVIAEARDGIEALSAVQSNQPDLVFLDLDMPRMGGMETLRNLNTLPSPPYTVIVTADDSAESRTQAMKLGASGFITKPYTTGKVYDLIEQYRATANPQFNVVIADDEPLMRDLLRSMLEKESCRVTYEASNGEEALAYLRDHPDIHMAFLDIDMPVLNGLDALNQIRVQKLRTFCTMVSAHSTVENVKTALDQGADGFIVKPYTAKKIQQILSKYRAQPKGP